jgi:predicted lactoylglutathione lyase
VDEETFNVSMRKFLKTVGVSSQREIEETVAKAIASGAVAGNETFPARMILRIPALDLEVAFAGEVKLA